MRTEAEMLDLIVNTARADDRIRAAILNGSRANSAAEPDPFRDYDVVYVVNALAPFVEDRQWLRRFGEIMIMQVPEEMGDPPPGAAERFSYLMQFTDGNRIDLTLIPSDVFARAASDSLTIVLLDKDGLLAGVPPPSDANYLPTPPSERAYADCCNEFWWMSTYVAKGLWRDELTYARAMLDQVMREELMDMLAWYVGVRTRFSVNVGKSGKYLRRYLEPELWRLLERTYADARSESAWEALFAMCRLFRGAAHEVGDHFGYQYPEGEDARVTAHLQHVRALPRTASEIY